jgi:phage baseplate assembly protein gpV
MKYFTTLLLALFSVLAIGQADENKEIIIDTVQTDDLYLAAEKIEVKAPVKGDLIVAGGALMVYDSIYGDLTGAGGELTIKGYVMDDVRLAGGKIIVDAEVGDDLVVFGGEVIITENARIHGKLVCSAGNVTMNGEVAELMKLRGSEVAINGTVKGASKIVMENLALGPDAKFLKDVEYYSADGEVDFKKSLVGAESRFSEELGGEESQLSLTTFGTDSLKLWIYYVLSAFLAILVIHALFRNAFSTAVEDLEKNLSKSFGFGLIYLFGIPLLILLAFLILIGIPLGLFAAGVFIFSLLAGHLVASLLVIYYWKKRKEKNWEFWKVTFLALGCAIILRLLTMIPFIGILISIVILSITYGALTLNVLKNRSQPVKI